MKQLSFWRLAIVLAAVPLCLTLTADEVAGVSGDPSIRRVSLLDLPNQPKVANVDFSALLAQPASQATDPNLSSKNAHLTTSPASDVKIISLTPRPLHRESLIVEYSGDPGPATTAAICFDALRFEGKPDVSRLCGTGPVINNASLPKLQQGLLTGLVRGASLRTQRNTRVTETILDPSTVSDAYGSRIAKKFVVFQVTVANQSSDYEFLVHDISVRFPFKLANPAAGSAVAGSIDPQKKLGTPDSSGIVDCEVTVAGDSSTCIELSSLDLSILQGVAERGSYTDTRNLVLRALTAAGTIAAGLQGVTTFGSSYAPAIAAFNGPLLTAYKEMFPDYTVNQLNRLNAKAYKANTVVAKGQAGVIAVFVPQAILMDRADSKAFLKDPHSIISSQSFASIKILVDGMFVTSADALAPSISNVTFIADPAKAQGDKPELKGFVLGSALSDVSIALGSGAPKGWKIAIDGTPSESRLDFTLTADGPIPPSTWVEVVLQKGTTSARSSGLISYQAAPPTATFDVATAALGSTVAITMTGTGFFPGLTTVTPPSGSRLSVSNLSPDKSNPTSKMTLTLAVDATAKPNHYPISVATPIGSISVDFTVTAK